MKIPIEVEIPDGCFLGPITIITYIEVLGKEDSGYRTRVHGSLRYNEENDPNGDLGEACTTAALRAITGTRMDS